MSDLRFEWDERKSQRNEEKHGVSFEEAKTVFWDEFGLLLADPDHSETEDRFLLLGLNNKLRALLDCHCVREAGDLIRIISARKADRFETADYNQGRRR